MSLLEQNITRKEQVDKIMSKLEFKNKGDSKEYKIKAICNNVVHISKLEDHLSSLYYLVLWKSYPKKKNTWELVLVVLHLYRLISTFHHDYSQKPTATSPLIYFIVSMARPIFKLIKALNTK